ncbi:MAG TPA: FAD-dependent oxidoreductase, partial [Aquamicrobium sp.]|nr:FAD-dependent oxidoreductase [Aquamicrobium sp.]
MATPSRHVAIAGAGIAGLTAALCLARRGFSVSVFERAERLEEVGAGIQLSPNATRILERLDLLGPVGEMAVRPEAVELYRAASLRCIATVPLAETALRRWRAPYLTIHRADLHGVLAQAVEACPDITLETGVTVRGATLADKGVSLAIERGGERAGENAEVACGLAIGADGVRSTLRGTGRLARRERFSGYVAWRAMTTPRAGNGLIPPDRVSAFLHPRFHLVAYPVRRGEATNLVVIARMDAPAESGAGAVRRLLPPGIVDGAADELDVFLAGIDTWLAWPVGEVAADAPWVEPAGLALIGDAAHAMGPYAAQGAVMAIEDAAALAAAVAARPGDLG